MPTIDKDEAEALAALDLARERCKPIEPDEWDGDGGSWVSAQKQDDVSAPILAELGIVIEFRGSKLVGGVGISTTWGWRVSKAGPMDLSADWRSDSTTIEVLVDRDRGAIPASSGAVTSARKAYVRQLLGLRTAEDHERGLAKAMDGARAAAFGAVKDALRAYCRRYRTTQDHAVRAFTGFDPGPGVEATVAMLSAPAVATLWYRLECALPHESERHDPGASPTMDDDLPEEMGGAANG